MLYGKIPPPGKVQDKFAGSRNRVSLDDMEYFSVLFPDIKNIVSVYRSPIRALPSAFGIKNGPVKHERPAAAAEPDFDYFRPGLSVAVKIDVIIIRFCSHGVMITLVLYFVHGTGRSYAKQTDR
jgi:hypothetical protein